jgi:hypothetical protein
MTTTMTKYRPEQFGHAMGKRADAVGDALLEAAGSREFLDAQKLSGISGLTAGSVPWYIFQLRVLGFVIESAGRDDRTAFAQGARGWRLVDVRQVSEAEREAWAEARRTYGADEFSAAVLAAGGIARGSRVRHPIHGEGRVAFARFGFPKVVVLFGERREKVDPDELEAIG